MIIRKYKISIMLNWLASFQFPSYSFPVSIPQSLSFLACLKSSMEFSFESFFEVYQESSKTLLIFISQLSTLHLIDLGLSLIVRNVHHIFVLQSPKHYPFQKINHHYHWHSKIIQICLKG